MKPQRKTALRAPRLSALRARMVLGLLAAGFVVLLGRAAYLQGMADERITVKGERVFQYSREIPIPGDRGRILDRNLKEVAISVRAGSIWAIPGRMKPDLSVQDLGELAQIIGVSPKDLLARIRSSQSAHVSLARQLSPDAAKRAEALGIPGVYTLKESKRVYPAREVTAHVVGFAGVDGNGLEGVERAYQGVLAGRDGVRRAIFDGRGRVVDDLEIMRPARQGSDLVLAIDSHLQTIAFESLRKAVHAHRAKGGAAVVLDVRTGEVLALVNQPTFNPNNPPPQKESVRMRNRAVIDAYEPGSTLKPFTVALALEEGKLRPGTVIQTGAGVLAIGPAVIRDVHPAGAITVEQVIQKSSNVGSALIARNLSAESMWTLFGDLGFGATPKLGFPGETSGTLRPYKTWRPVEQATMSFGHGISASLIHLARAYTAFARDGELIPLSLTKVASEPVAKRVLSVQTAREMRKMLEMAVQPGGTGVRAQVMGYRVGGKTGTARKIENGDYAPDKHYSSFVGIAPMSAPRLVVAVMIDEPSAGQSYGGVVAAPLFSEIMGGALEHLSVPHDAPLKPIELPPPGAEAKENL